MLPMQCVVMETEFRQIVPIATFIYAEIGYGIIPFLLKSNTNTKGLHVYLGLLTHTQCTLAHTHTHTRTDVYIYIYTHVAYTHMSDA